MTDRESPYNGIETPAVWPPQHIETDSAPLAVPYLNNSPPVIPIDTGRQLFVDDFLIEHSTLRRIYHSAKSHQASPVLVPETELECNQGHCPVVAPFNDGFGTIRRITGLRCGATRVGLMVLPWLPAPTV